MTAPASQSNWPAGVPQPREKLLAQGAHCLTDAELLALVLRTGLPGVNVVVYAEQLLETHGGLYQLLQSVASGQGTPSPGLGPGKRMQLQAILVLAERYLNARLAGRSLLNSSSLVQDFLRLKLGDLQREVFAVLFLDTGNRLQHFEIMFQGTINQAEVHPREVARAALERNSKAVILAHNHPSGLVEPSSADMVITKRLQQALALFDIAVLDHVVVGPTASLSFAEQGML